MNNIFVRLRNLSLFLARLRASSRLFYSVVAGILISTFMVPTSSAQIVRMETDLGNIDFRLFNMVTPVSVENFLNYLNNGDYDGTVIHRSSPGFVIQGGGFRFDAEEESFDAVPTEDPIMNEPYLSNTRGTIAFAKISPSDGQPTEETINSATNQWFFNLDNQNHEDLDVLNGGFSVFGSIIGNSFEVLDLIQQLPTQDLDPEGAAFDNVPLKNEEDPLSESLVVVNQASVLDIPDGDYNLNGRVNNADLIPWSNRYGSPFHVAADGNGNAVVDGSDFLIWQRNFGAMAPGIAAVPEPAGLLLVGSSLAWGLLARRR